MAACHSGPMELETRCVHGSTRHDTDSAVVPPIVYSATFAAAGADEFAEMASTAAHERYYTRYGNPLHTQVAGQLAALETAGAGGYGALCTSTGMAAISLVLLGLVRAGDHVVAQTNHYMATAKHLDELLPRFGVSTTVVDQTDPAAFAAAITDRTTLVMIETPVNPTCAVTDIAAVCEVAQRAGALVVCDNTFASPVNQQPLLLGADVVVQSATKFLGGHHDLMAGAVVARDELIERLWPTSICLGATLSPMDAWLLLRGIKTLALRVRQQNRTAQLVAEHLEAHPKVSAVRYPGLASHPQHALAARQMHGFGGLMSIEIDGDYAATARFVQALRLPHHAVSLGGVDSLVVHAAAMWAGTMDDAQMRTAGVAPNSVRLSVGIEHPDDLIADIDQALAQV